ncbi:MAG: uroporphyrinogen-III C-methyltransferase [Planctomycetaceae bacterium]|jgi:uroporphyrinogen III methyltransferase/synthase|nr:uroporphyrinogen-III C-methyltransferase [Planctomycetaceae bacterium]
MTKLYIVGAGPGAPDLLTLRAVKYIALADYILYDYLVDKSTLQYARPDAELVPLKRPHTKQSEINSQMIEAARSGKTVVRLKGGDPHIFGRLNEETQALRDAGIEYEVVPGVTSATAAAQAANISLTDRRSASAVALITGHLSHEHDPTLPALDFAKFATFPGTLVFYMGVVTVELWSKELINNGKSKNTNVKIIQNATQANERVIQTTLSQASEIVEQENLQSPCIVIVE